MDPGLTDLWCCWCQRCFHNDCKFELFKVCLLHFLWWCLVYGEIFIKFFQICDFGKFKLMIIPPSSLEVINLRSTV